MSARVAVMHRRLAALDPVLLDIIDESHQHAGHAGARDGGGHYALRIVSAQFGGNKVFSNSGMSLKRIQIRRFASVS